MITITVHSNIFQLDIDGTSIYLRHWKSVLGYIFREDKVKIRYTNEVFSFQ